MKILYNLFLFLLIGLLIFSNSSQLDFLNMVNQTIKINVKGNAVKDKVYTLKRGSTVEDLLGIIEHNDDVDLSCLNLTMVLKNNDVIVLNKKKELEKISINSADLNQLMEIPYVGEKTALLIIEYRNTHGSFKTIEEIMEIKGIGLKKFEKMKEYIRL
ncbi:MAG: helix-hairpin-helix domain-containing protein [Bacillota bacterium]|mgnify:CR=1 FL=1|jgi:competence protein ComEA|nr:helix-hairpin-helix domain-containing protein [Bacillota bacterium]NLL26906.1 helix-hairpin-helix domain-containing protein [Erysipelotrichia bacterium]